MNAGRRDKLRRYETLKTALEKLLYEYDPDGMGSTVGAPLDEYSDAAVTLMRALRDRRPDVPITEAVRDAVPGATNELIAEIEKRWNASL